MKPRVREVLFGNLPNGVTFYGTVHCQVENIKVGRTSYSLMGRPEGVFEAADDWVVYVKIQSPVDVVQLLPATVATGTDLCNHLRGQAKRAAEHAALLSALAEPARATVPESAERDNLLAILRRAGAEIGAVAHEIQFDLGET